MASFKKALLAGVAGTVVMTVFSFISHYLHLPKADFHGMIGTYFKMGEAVSWGLYFAFGIGLAYLYGAFFKSMLPAHSWGRGMVYSLILWGVMEMVLMPVFGMGFFSGSMAMAGATLIGMGLYGATVGYMYEH